MDSKKVFIILLLLIGVLFVVALSLGAFHSDNQTFSQPSWVNNFGNVLARPQPLQFADLDQPPTNCIQQENFIVQPGSTCTFSIKKSTFSTRVVLLQLLQGASVTVSLSQEDTLTVQHSFPETTATTKDDLKVFPGKAHAVLAIQCINAGSAPACLLGFSK